ncbi:MAG TPA: hypothetical protein VK610_09190 [Rhodothermales bacterium]|nr:hypothetical protein [Rhodothermales bacterium]
MPPRTDTLDVIWYEEGERRDFLTDLKAFAMSLDACEVRIDLNATEGRHVLIAKGHVTLARAPMAGEFQCPSCGGASFDVMEGVYEGRRALGLGCQRCEGYGAVFPDGV